MSPRDPTRPVNSAADCPLCIAGTPGRHPDKGGTHPLIKRKRKPWFKRLRAVMDERIREHGTDQEPSTAETLAEDAGVPTAEYLARPKRPRPVCAEPCPVCVQEGRQLVGESGEPKEPREP